MPWDLLFGVGVWASALVVAFSIATITFRRFRNAKEENLFFTVSALGSTLVIGVTYLLYLKVATLDSDTWWFTIVISAITGVLTFLKVFCATALMNWDSPDQNKAK